MEASRMELSDGPEIIDVDAGKAASVVVASLFAMFAVSSAFIWIPVAGVISALAALTAGLTYMVKTGWSWNDQKNSALSTTTNVRSFQRSSPSPAQIVSDHDEDEEEVQYRYGT